MKNQYDAILIVAFGGPEGPDDVVPFLENVLRGKNVPRGRMLEVAEHYQLFGGKSPINDHVRGIIAALRPALDEVGLATPIYWGNRNWRPMLADTLREMADDGVFRALAFFTSAYSSYSSCRQYLEDIARAQNEVGERAPRVDKLRAFYNHPLFLEATVDRVGEALRRFPPDKRSAAKLIFTAHSIPQSMADGCRYESQLRETSARVAEAIGHANWRLAFQSRSGPPSQPWLAPDVCDYLRQTSAAEKITHAVIAPIGFLSDHVEVLYDLDVEARDVCKELGVEMIRAATINDHPKFIALVRDLIVERMSDLPERPCVGDQGPLPDVCPADCCPSGRTMRSS